LREEYIRAMKEAGVTDSGREIGGGGDKEIF